MQENNNKIKRKQQWDRNGKTLKCKPIYSPHVTILCCYNFLKNFLFLVSMLLIFFSFLFS